VEKIKIKFKKLHKDAKLPTKGTSGSTGWDLYCVDYTIDGYVTTVRTGLAIEIPCGYYAKLTGRSGMFFNYKSLAFHGLIDSDYRGEVMIGFRGHIHVPYGSRVAQLTLHEEIPVEWEESPLSETERGDGGFGSTGK
jgi:deoxyuridine 5'-triphosphate nucleotidohydrolase